MYKAQVQTLRELLPIHVWEHMKRMYKAGRMDFDYEKPSQYGPIIVDPESFVA